MRWKWFFGICGLVLIAALIAGYAFLSSYDFNELKPTIQKAVSSATGRKLDLAGEIHFDIGLSPTVIIQDVRFQNAPWGSEPWMIQAKQLRLRLALLPLFNKTIRIRELAVVEPTVLMERGPSGALNLALSDATEEHSGKKEDSSSLASAIVTMLSFDRVCVEKGRLVFREGASDAHVITIDQLVARAASVTSPISLTVRGTHHTIPFQLSALLAPLATLRDPDIPHAVEATGRLEDVEVEIKGVVKDIWRARGLRLTLLAKGPSVAPLLQLAGLDQTKELGPFELSVTAGDPKGHVAVDKFRVEAGREDLMNLELAGSIADPVGWSGVNLTFRARGNDLKRLGPFFGKAIPAEGSFDISGHVDYEGEKAYHFSSVDAILQGTHVEGSGTFHYGGTKPRFSGTLSAEKLDLRPYLSGRKKGINDPKPNPKKIFPNTRLPVDHLKEVDVDLTLRVETLLVPHFTMDGLHAHIQLSDGHLAFKEFRSVIADGSFAGELDFRPVDPAPTLTASLNVQHMDLSALLKEWNVKYALDGHLDMDIALAGSGYSVSELLAGLNGEISMSMGEGLIDNEYLNYLGADVATTMLRIFNPFQREGHTTEINCFAGRFDIQDGVARSTALVMDTADTVVVGDGEVNLDTEELDLSLKTAVKRGIGVPGIGKISLNLGQLTRPLKLTGTLSDPDVVVDPAQTAVMVGKALGGITLFGPFGIVAVLVSGNFGDENPCLAAIKAAEEKKQDQENGEAEERERIRRLADDVGGTLYWQNER